MSRRDLDHHLSALRAELDRVSAGGALDEERLTELLHSVEHDLGPDDEPETPEGLLDGLKRWAEALELEHPTLAAMLNRVMITLGNTGI